MKKFKHIVFTRQALYWGRVPMDNDVINYRLDLFEKTLLKSIQRQTDQNFTFVQLVSDQVDQALKDRIKEYGEIVWVTRTGEHGPDAEALRKYITRTISDVNAVITTNIDSDDIPSINYVEQVHRLFDTSYKSGETILICPRDRYHVSRYGHTGSLSSSPRCVDPLLTVIEPFSRRLKTARYVNHDKMLPYFSNFVKLPVSAIYITNEANIWREYNRTDIGSLNRLVMPESGLDQEEFDLIFEFLCDDKTAFIPRRKKYKGER